MKLAPTADPRTHLIREGSGFLGTAEWTWCGIDLYQLIHKTYDTEQMTCDDCRAAMAEVIKERLTQ